MAIAEGVQQARIGCANRRGPFQVLDGTRVVVLYVVRKPDAFDDLVLVRMIVFEREQELESPIGLA